MLDELARRRRIELLAYCHGGTGERTSSGGGGRGRRGTGTETLGERLLKGTPGDKTAIDGGQTAPATSSPRLTADGKGERPTELLSWSWIGSNGREGAPYPFAGLGSSPRGAGPSNGPDWRQEKRKRPLCPSPSNKKKKTKEKEKEKER